MADKHLKAAGLRYRPDEDRAPKVVAKGRRKVAEEILALAREHGIPVYEDPAVADLLVNLELNTGIPEELYVAVARILSFVYRMDGLAARPVAGGRV